MRELSKGSDENLPGYARPLTPDPSPAGRERARLGDRLPLLITGVTGWPGSTHGGYFQRRIPARSWASGRRKRGLTEPGILALNADDRDDLLELFRLHRFRSVLNATGNCALKSCELDPSMARRLNVTGVEAVAIAVREHGARLVHLSSDLVFSGNGAGNYDESAPVDPVTVYGRTMAEAEAVVGALAPASAVVRIALPMGPSLNRHAGAIDWIWSRFRAGRPATLYFDEVRSCTYCDDLNPVFERFLGGDPAGLFHLGAPRAITLYQIGQVVNRVGGHDPSLLMGCLRHEAGPMPPRAGNVSMNSGKLAALFGTDLFRSWPVGDDVFPLDRDWHRRREEGEEGSHQRIVERLYHYASSEQALHKPDA